MLNATKLYCNACGMKINLNKTKLLIFEKGGRHLNYNFCLYNEQLEVISSFMYLGVYFFKKWKTGSDRKTV